MITRLGVCGIPRPPYGSFAGKTPTEAAVVEQSLGNLGFGDRKPQRPKERKFEKDTLRAEIEDLFRETRDIVVPKAVEQQIVKIVAPGSDRIPSGISIGDLLQSLQQMRELRDILLDLKARQQEEEMLIFLMMA